MESPWEELQDRILLGGVDYIASIKKQACETLKRDRTPAWMRERITVGENIKAVDKAKKEAWTEIKDRHGDGGLAMALSLARKTAA
jgi:hypothetical protein